jgi:hypothetical protein
MSKRKHPRPPKQPAIVATGIAAAQGQDLMDQIHRQAGGTAWQVDGPLPGILGRWHAQLAERLRSKDTRLCAHIAQGPPTPMHWLVWAPNTLRCTACANRALQAIHGSPADDVCDDCGGTFPVLHVVAGEIPAALDPTLGIGFGPIIIRGGICTACSRRNDMEMASAPVVSSSTREPETTVTPGGDDEA